MQTQNTIHDQIKALVIQHYNETGVKVTDVQIDWTLNLAGEVLRVAVSLDSQK